MFDPSLDPYEDLRQCMIAIAHQQQILDTLIKTHNTILQNQQKQNHLISTTRHLIERLQKQLNEIKQAPTDDRPRRE